MVISVKVSFISGFIFFSQAGLSAGLAWLTQGEKNIRVTLPDYPIICIWQDVIAFVNTAALTLSLTIQKNVLCRTPGTF